MEINDTYLILLFFSYVIYLAILNKKNVTYLPIDLWGREALDLINESYCSTGQQCTAHMRLMELEL